MRRLAALLPLMKLQLWRLLVGLVAALVIAASIGGGSTTTVGAATYTYDAPALARVDAHVFGAAQASLAVLSEVWDWSGSPAASLRGESTTPIAPVVATEAEINGAGMVRLGQDGEAAVRGAYDIGDKATAVIDGRTRIFDGLNGEAVSEVKNVASQSFTQQLRDSASYAQANGLRFDLYVRPDTYLTGPLLQAITDGTVNLRFIP